MIYLHRFSLPSEGAELHFLTDSRENRRTCYTSRYPFGIFFGREVPTLELEPVTILCGGNGSGKTTVLNLMGEKLSLRRGTVFNRSSFFGDYLDLCRAETAPAFRDAREHSRVITSDDVFDYLLDLRYMNENIDHRRRELLAEYADARYAKFQMRSMEDIDRLRQVVDAQRRTGSRYVRDRVMNDVVEKSNGESAFAFFTKEIQEGGLYLLDEPENSLSPKAPGGAAGLFGGLRPVLPLSVRHLHPLALFAVHAGGENLRFGQRPGPALPLDRAGAHPNLLAIFS